MATVTHKGSCHCGAVRFEVDATAALRATACNCSICTKSGFLHLIVPASRFRLLAGKAKLTTYRFNTAVAQHTFCSICGVKPFYVPRSNPDGFSVNVHCLEPETIEHIEVVPFDGQNWEENSAQLLHLSAEPLSDPEVD